MILVNALLGLGALAFTVPLAIHLLFRNRFEWVDWGAMQFLQAVVRQNRRRLQLRNLLLLLIRCAIPVLLAFCMARPVMTQWRQPRGDSPVSMVVVLDNSYSVAAVHDGDRRRIDVLTDAAKQISESLGRGSEITLLTSDGELRTGDPRSIGARIDEITVGGGPLDLEQLLSRAVRISADSPLANRQIVILADRSSADYSQTMLDGLAALARRIEDLKPSPEVAWIDPLGPTVEPLRNIRVHRVEPQTTVAVPGQVVPWFVEARTDGLQLRDLELVVRVNGTTQLQKVVPVTGNSATTVVPLRIDETGRHVVEIGFTDHGENRIAGSIDQFAPDDRVWRDCVVIDPVLVWLVDGQPSGKALASDTDFLAVALSPFSLSGQATDPTRPADLFRTRKVRAGRLTNEAANQEMPAIVVLANVARPAGEDVAWLVDFVRGGGVLVVFAGPAVDPVWYEEQVTSPQFGPLLPMRFGDLREAKAGIAIDDSKLVYPPLAPLADQERGTLSSATVTGWRELIRRGETGPDAQVLISMENTEPLFVLAPYGRGQVVQVATTANETWTSLPLRPVYLPLMQRLMAHFAVGRGGSAGVAAGQPIVVDGIDRSARWTVTTPDGQSHVIVANDDEANAPANRTDARSAGNATQDTATPDNATQGTAKLVWPAARSAGGYRFESDAGQVIWTAVNVPPVDLKPAMVDPEVLVAAAQRLGAKHHGATEDFLVDDANRRFGRPIWQYVLMVLIVAMVIETVLQQQRGKLVTT